MLSLLKKTFSTVYTPKKETKNIVPQHICHKCPLDQYYKEILKYYPKEHFVNKQGNPFIKKSPWESNELLLNDPYLRKLAKQSSLDNDITRVYEEKPIVYTGKTLF